MKKVSRFALLLLLLVVEAGSVAIATPQYDTVTTYYADAAMTVINGRKWEMCSGTWYTGTQSGYIDYWYGESCNSTIPQCVYSEDGRLCPGSCTDFIDNDYDGVFDGADPGCS
jgi:hypothetical protein